MNQRKNPYIKYFDKLFDYCQNQDWKGHDPYDGLNASILKFIPLFGKLPRIAWIQIFKRSPINLRQLTFTKQKANPKGHSLAIRALFNRAKFAISCNENHKIFEDEASKLLLDLSNLRSKKTDKAAWGYPFDWQSRAFFVPRDTPSIVSTTFVAQAYLDAYEYWKKKEYLEIARSSCDFILNDLARTADQFHKEQFCFSYTPLDKTQVHNANLLGAALLARVFTITKEVTLIEAAKNSAKYSIDRQQQDGSWMYGEAFNQQWIDSFHTGFNLICIEELIRNAEWTDLEENLNRGFSFFCNNFFLSNGMPKYYSNKIYPIDIHSSAQAFVTLSKLSYLNSSALVILKNCIEWTLKNMISKDGYFYFQKTALLTNRISYLRWSQTWMLYGLSVLFNLDFDL